MFDIHAQFILFIYSLFIGIYLGVSYDLVDIFIIKYVKKTVAYAIQIIFFLVQGYIVFRVLVHINDGLIPLYSYLLFLAGFLLYHRLANDYHRNHLTPVEKSILWLMKWLRRFFVYMVIDPILDVWKVMKWIFRRLLKWFERFKKKLKGYYQWIRKKFKRKSSKKRMKPKKAKKRIRIKIPSINN